MTNRRGVDRFSLRMFVVFALMMLSLLPLLVPNRTGTRPVTDLQGDSTATNPALTAAPLQK